MEEEMRKNSIKNTRINGEVLRELSNIIRGDIKDPRIHPMTSVVTVEVAPDLKTCKAYISVLGDEEAQKNTLLGLKSAEGYIRRALARSINLRNTPQITFILDQSIEYGVRMSKMIDDVTKDLHEDSMEESAPESLAEEYAAEDSDVE
jgi:ribosome-binding factor A